MPDLTHKYEYNCSKGHYNAGHQELARCAVARCNGLLVRIGRGSRPRAKSSHEPQAREGSRKAATQ